MFTAVIATLAVNIAANVVSPANDFANAFPKKIDFKRGGLITGIVGIAMMPWELLKDGERYINGWLGGYGARARLDRRRAHRRLLAHSQDRARSALAVRRPTARIATRTAGTWPP